MLSVLAPSTTACARSVSMPGPSATTGFGISSGGTRRRFPLVRHTWRGRRRHYWEPVERSVFVLRQFESLPRPLRGAEARELLAALQSPYDLMARWQLYTGLKVSELLRLRVQDALTPQANKTAPDAPYRSIDVRRKGSASWCCVIASRSLLEETACYICQERVGWMRLGGPQARTTTASGALR